MRQTVQKQTQKVVRIKAKTVAANQKAIEALPLGSGMWRVEGERGLFVRCRARTRSFWIQRRVQGELIKRTLGEITLREARAEVHRVHDKMKPAPPGGRKTFGQAFDEFLEHRELGVRTRAIYTYNVSRYLESWKGRPLEVIGEDLEGVRSLYHVLARKYGKATASQVLRMFSAVYNYARRARRTLPENPAAAVDLPTIKPRDWALSPDQLREWLMAVVKLGPIKRTWWLTCLLTGARRGSVEALEWSDVDFDKRTIRFKVVKGDRPYMVPASDRLIAILTAYRDAEEVPPSRWVFPSSVKPETHLVNVRDDKRGVLSAHHLRHTFKTAATELGITPDQSKLLMGHSLAGDVGRGYITAGLLVEAVRPAANLIAEHYAKILKW